MGGGWGMESDRERRDRVREIKEILRQKKKSRESREKIGRKEGRGGRERGGNQGFASIF